MSRIHRYARVVHGHPHGRIHSEHHQHRQQTAETALSDTANPSDPALYADDLVLCRCRQVTVRQVKEAIAGGAATVEQVMTLTDLGQACGHCVGKAWPIVQDLLAAK